jgi:hypothetical protein
MLDGTRVAADYSSFSSTLFLGVVVKDGDNDEKGSITLRNCTIADMWGASVGADVSEAACKVLTAVNTFTRNSDGDITRMYDDTGHSIQPWRRGWTTD